MGPRLLFENSTGDVSANCTADELDHQRKHRESPPHSCGIVWAEGNGRGISEKGYECKGERVRRTWERCEVGGRRPDVTARGSPRVRRIRVEAASRGRGDRCRGRWRRSRRAASRSGPREQNRRRHCGSSGGAVADCGGKNVWRERERRGGRRRQFG